MIEAHKKLVFKKTVRGFDSAFLFNIENLVFFRVDTRNLAGLQLHYQTKFVKGDYAASETRGLTR